MRLIHNGVVWVCEVRGGWYSVLKAFPRAKGIQDPEVLLYEKKVMEVLDGK